MTPEQLRDLISRLPVEAPISDEAERLYWPRHHRAWFKNQREHWLGYLDDKFFDGETAEEIYSNIGTPAMLLWLAEASGVPEETLRPIIKRLRSLKYPHARVTAIRSTIPWRIIKQNLERSPP